MSEQDHQLDEMVNAIQQVSDIQYKRGRLSVQKEIVQILDKATDNPKDTITALIEYLKETV
jgi:hypothetical protein